MHSGQQILVSRAACSQPSSTAAGNLKPLTTETHFEQLILLLYCFHLQLDVLKTVHADGDHVLVDADPLNKRLLFTVETRQAVPA